MSRLEDAAERRPGDLHPHGGVLLFHAFAVGKADGLELVERHDDRIAFALWGLHRREQPCAWASRYATAADRSGHECTSPLIMSI
jgi:alkanesulfonate monooxygenase SsuD/methylene tetrahydromethanopterin reductase-like flavin-dependent oxidoreductase (luciferase family)